MARDPAGITAGAASASAQPEAVAAFRALHASGCFVLPNPWDAGTAVFLQHLGFAALATTSAGYGFSRGLPDHPGALQLEPMLAHIREVVAATSLPVNADFQQGFSDDPEGVAAHVTRCVGTGVAGLSIEDATGHNDSPLYGAGHAVERIRSARAAIDASGVPVVLTGRCEAWLVGQEDPLPFAVKRLVAYSEAGADCLYAPGVQDPEDIAALVKAVAPKPLNVLMSRPNPELSVARLAELGVRRVSLGSALARTAWGAFIRASRDIATTGTFDALDGAAPFAELNKLFENARRAGA